MGERFPESAAAIVPVDGSGWMKSIPGRVEVESFVDSVRVFFS
jgi:hypothetical protein